MADEPDRENYYEAAGIMAGMKAGVAPSALARPMEPLRVDRLRAKAETQ